MMNQVRQLCVFIISICALTARLVYAEVTSTSTGAAKCVIYLAQDLLESLTLPAPLNEDTEILSVDSSVELTDQALAGILNDQNFVVRRKQNQVVVSFSFLDPKGLSNWVPVDYAIDLKGDLSPDELLNCKQLNLIKDWERLKREATHRVFQLFVQAPSSKGATKASSSPSSKPLLGHEILKMEYIYLWEKYGERADLQLAFNRYLTILEFAKSLERELSTPSRFFTGWKKLLKFIYNDQPEAFDLNYCRANTLLTDALNKRCTNCVGETSLMIALIEDLKISPSPNWQFAIELFSDHSRPIFYDQNRHQVYDLAYGVFDDPKAAIHPVKSFYYSTLKGFDGLFHPLEKQDLQQYSPEALWTPFLCFAGIDFGPLLRAQLPDFSGLAACRRFNSGDPPEFADNSYRSQMVSIEERDIPNQNEKEQGSSAAQAGSDSELDEDGLNEEAQSDSEKSTTGATRANSSDKDGVNGRFKGEGGYFDYVPLIDAVSDVFDFFARRKKFFETFFFEDYLQFLESLNEVDREIVVRAAEKNNHSGIRLFVENFNLLAVLDHLGAHPHIGSKAISNFYHVTQTDIECQALPFLRVSFGEETMVYERGYYNDPILILPLNVNSAGSDLSILSVIDRYKYAFDHLESDIKRQMAVLDQAFNQPSFTETIKILADQSDKELRALAWNLNAYRHLVERLLRNGCPSFLGYNDQLSKAILRSTFLATYSDTIERALGFSRRIGQAPIEFLKALTQVMDESNTYDLNLNLETISLEILELAKLFDLNLSMPGLLVEQKSLFDPFIPAFLFHKDYFFTGPADEGDPFGSVRPFVQLKLPELFLPKNALVEIEDPISRIQPPKVEVEPCRAGEVGYIERGLFNIFCEGGEGGESESETKNALDDPRSESVFDGEGLELFEGLDDSGEEVFISPRDRELTPSHATTETLPQGSENGTSRLDESQSIVDPRIEVVIEPKYWKTLGLILLSALDGAEISIAIHHLTRPSISAELNQNNLIRLVYAEELSPDFLIWRNREFEAPILSVFQNRISLEDALKRIRRETLTRIAIQRDKTVPYFFAQSQILSSQYRSFTEFKKPLWHNQEAKYLTQMPVTNSYSRFISESDFFLAPSSTRGWEKWSDLCQTPYSVMRSNAMVCSSDASIDEIMKAIEDYFLEKLQKLERDSRLQ